MDKGWCLIEVTWKYLPYLLTLIISTPTIPMFPQNSQMLTMMGGLNKIDFDKVIATPQSYLTTVKGGIIADNYGLFAPFMYVK